MICWKRRSSAPSFSMYLRYSSRVVAPMHCISPRDRAGLSTLLASIEADGSGEIDGLAPGRWTVNVPGAKPVTVEVTAGASVTAELRLE